MGNKMKYAVSAAALAAALGFASVAHAGGSLKDTPVEPVYHAPIWEGLYFGGFGGYAWTDATYDKLSCEAASGGTPDQCPDPTPYTFTPFDYDLDGGLVGGQIGYDFQRGEYVFGIVGDYSGLNADDVFNHGRDGDFYHKVELETVGTLRGRLGYAFDHSLIYATAGVAYVNVELSACSGGKKPGCKIKPRLDDSYTSFVIGTGFEKQIADSVSLFAEYLYIDGGDVGPSGLAPGAESDWENTVEMDSINMIKVGVNFRLGGMRHEEPLK